MTILIFLALAALLFGQMYHAARQACGPFAPLWPPAGRNEPPWLRWVGATVMLFMVLAPLYALAYALAARLAS